MAILRTDIEFMSSQRLLTADVDDWVSMSGGENPDDAAYVLSTIALYHAERWEIDAARESLTRARALLDGCSPATVDAYGRAAMVLAAFGGDPGPANAVFDRVSRHGVASTPIPTLAWLGRALSSLDRHTEARRIFTAIINLEPAPDPVWLQTTRYWHAEDEILAGNQVEAMAAIDELEGTTADIRLHQCTRQLLMAWYWQVRGNRAESEAAIAECHRSFAAGDNPALTARLAAYQGGFALAEKRFEDAIAFLRMAASIGEGFRNPTMQRYRVDLIEAYAASGRLAEANEQLRQLRRETQTRPTRWSNLATSRATALVTPGQPGIAAFQQAIRSWHPGDPQYELGRAVLGYAEHLRALGQLPESREQFLTARMIFTQLGATSWVRKSESAAPLNEAPREHPLLASLAPDERLVADLVCQGLRNKEIAARLFVSLRTVEVRLTRIYQKVGARSRAHLTAMLATSETVIGAGRTAS
jgi:DNA-binding CsgD family transcriptional regulator